MTEGPKAQTVNFRQLSVCITTDQTVDVDLVSPFGGDLRQMYIYWSIRAMGKAGASKIMNKGHFDDEHILNV
jgi:hypothetical protein